MYDQFLRKNTTYKMNQQEKFCRGQVRIGQGSISKLQFVQFYYIFMKLKYQEEKKKKKS